MLQSSNKSPFMLLARIIGLSRTLQPPKMIPQLNPSHYCRQHEEEAAAKCRCVCEGTYKLPLLGRLSSFCEGREKQAWDKHSSCLQAVLIRLLKWNQGPAPSVLPVRWTPTCLLMNSVGRGATSSSGRSHYWHPFDPVSVKLIKRRQGRKEKHPLLRKASALHAARTEKLNVFKTFKDSPIIWFWTKN